jgi:hypothetical protein
MMNNQKQKIRTISVKALFKYFPKEKGHKVYAIYLTKKSWCRLVIKQEEDMESCPVFYQFYKEIEKRCKESETFEITNTTLTDKFVVMDFEDVFMSCDYSASDSVKTHKKLIQECARDIIKKGFDIYTEESDKPVHMVAFDKSGNMSRKSRISFIDETYYDTLNERLNLGMDFSQIKVQESKYYAYRGLYLSSSQRVEHESIEITPETLIVLQDERKDPKNPQKSITGYNYERSVKYITAKENKDVSNDSGKVWDFEDEQEKELLYISTPFDGEGFVSPAYAEFINESLGTEGATTFQVRLPFIKGMLHCVDVHDFLERFNKDRISDKHIYVDAFGIERDLSKAQIFITESMFKGKKWIKDYLEQIKDNHDDPMVFYCDMLKEYDHALYISGTNLPYGHSKYVHLSYQTINTLNFTHEQFYNILDRHKSYIEHPDEYLNSFVMDDDSEIIESDEGKIDYHIPNWRRALYKNNLLAGDAYIKHELRNTQKGLMTKLATGKLLVEGQTRYLCRDLLPLLVSMLEKPNINDWFYGYLYYRFYLPVCADDKNAAETGLDFNSYYAFFRNPHLSRNEQYIMRRFCHTDEATYRGKADYKKYKEYMGIYDKYFGNLTGIVMVPRHSVMPLCLGGADFDGDLVSVVYNQDVVAAVASGVFKEVPNEEYGAFYQRNLPVIEIPSTCSETVNVKKHVPYEHIKNTFSNRIGQISDAAISIGQKEYGHELITTGVEKTGCVLEGLTATCEMCTILTGLEIDAAKNGEHPNLDIILNNSIEQSPYIDFLHKFKRLRSEVGYSFNKLKIEAKEHSHKECIEVTAKECKTIARFYIPEFGTYINELPVAFYKAYSSFAKNGRKNKKVGETNETIFFTYDDKKNDVLAQIDGFKKECQNIFDYYFFYANVIMQILKNEKNKKFYAMENLEKLLYQIYDEKEAVRIQTRVVPQLIEHLKDYINQENSVDDIKARINEKMWLFIPKDRRHAVLEEIIGKGFNADILGAEEKELLFDFHNHGYKNLWLVLTIIEGPKTSSFETIMARNIKSNINLKNEKLDAELIGFARDYYDNNSTDAMNRIYAACLKELRNIIKQSNLSDKNLIAALYKLTGSSRDNRKFFWDVFSWENLEKSMKEV